MKPMILVMSLATLSIELISPVHAQSTDYFKVNAALKCYDTSPISFKPIAYRNKELIALATHESGAQLVTEGGTLQLHVVDKCGTPIGAPILNYLNDNCAFTASISTGKRACVEQMGFLGGDTPVASAFCKETVKHNLSAGNGEPINGADFKNRNCKVQIFYADGLICDGSVNSGGKPFKPDSSCK